jgi:hypothetical protein
MKLRTSLATIAAVSALVMTAGCAVSRGQETVGAYVDDASITTSVKARMIEDKAVDAAAIKVETLNGNVMLSGFAKDYTEKSTAESIAMRVKGVKSVQNNIAAARSARFVAGRACLRLASAQTQQALADRVAEASDGTTMGSGQRRHAASSGLAHQPVAMRYRRARVGLGNRPRSLDARLATGYRVEAPHVDRDAQHRRPRRLAARLDGTVADDDFLEQRLLQLVAQGAGPALLLEHGDGIIRQSHQPLWLIDLCRHAHIERHGQL